MASLPLVRIEPLDVAARLADFALTVDVLRDAVLAGEIARASCTANDPPAFPGFSAWAVTTRVLRELLMPEDWTKSDKGGFSTVISPDGLMAIVVATGDDSTGNSDKPPKTKFPRGPITQEAVQRNGQYDLFASLVDPGRGTMPAETTGIPVVTWMLLIARKPNALQAELSLPAAIGDDLRVEKWNERIILPSIRPDDDDQVPLPTPAPSPDFDVDVVRRIG